MARAGKNRIKRQARRFKELASAVVLPAPMNAPTRRPIEDPGTWGESQAFTKAAVAGKVMPPPVENMFARGLLTPEQYQAALEIERVFHWVTSGLKVRVFDATAVHGAKSDGPDALQAAYTERYKPWADELSGNRMPPPDVNDMARVLRSVGDDDLIEMAARTPTEARRGGNPHPKTLAIVIAVVVDGRPIDETAQDEGVRAATVRQAFRDGVTLYAERAGWLRRVA